MRHLLSPPHCEGCEAFVSNPPELCPECFNLLQFLDGSVCELCGLPWEGGAQSSHLCGDCVKSPPTYKKVYAPLKFNDKLGSLLHAVKFGKRISSLKVLARMGEIGFARALEDFQPDLILPVPLSWRRQLFRGFNQSYLLSRYLMQGVDQKVPIFSKVGRAYRPAQATKDRKSRLQAVRGVYRVSDGLMLGGKKILIVDDVLTTGATVEELSRTLEGFGVGEIRVFVLSRVEKINK